MLAVDLTDPSYPTTLVCRLLDVPRSSLYRARKPKKPTCNHDKLVESIEKVILEESGSGSRRVAERLKKDGWSVGRRLVRHLMKEHSLLCQIKRKWVHTTDSRHGLRRWPNLVKGTQITGTNQVWLSDITYIRLPRGF